MNRRSFLKFCGIAPVVPKLASELLSEPTQTNTTGQPMFRALESGKKGDVIACEITWEDNMLPVKERVYYHSWTPGTGEGACMIKVDMTKDQLKEFKNQFGLT